MRAKVDFYIHNEEGKIGHKLTFDSVEEMDACIEKMIEARTLLVHRIEANKIKAKEKRERRKKNRVKNNVPEEVLESLRKAEESFEKMDDFLKPFFKPMLDAAKSLVEEKSKQK